MLHTAQFLCTLSISWMYWNPCTVLTRT